jgi:cyanamide hydratase
MSNPEIEKYGWTAVPRKFDTLLAQSQAASAGPAKPISVASIQLPDSPLVKAVHEYAKKELAIETFNHSMRVFYYGTAPTPSPRIPCKKERKNIK